MLRTVNEGFSQKAVGTNADTNLASGSGMILGSPITAGLVRCLILERRMYI
jgi:hypothetical protein